MPRPRPLRESIAEPKFLLEHLEWTSWQKVMTPDLEGRSSQWPCVCLVSGCAPGLYKKTLTSPARRCRQSALYEFAVQAPSSGRRMVAYVTATQGIRQPSRWTDTLLHTNLIKGAVDDVLRKGCSVWFRMVSMDSKTTVKVGNKEVTGPFAAKLALLSKYNYAWNGRHKRDIEFKWVMITCNITVTS